jgi:hypothetical protein
LSLLDSDSPPVRVMALHAIAYRRRLFHLEEVEVVNHREVGLQLNLGAK